jgi:hypothetical protein
MIRLIYVSKATSRLPPELRDILEVSRRNNRPAGITGALCLINGVYLQYLEGEEAVIAPLLERIAADPRHSGTKVLDRSPIENRAFSSWTMGLLTWDRGSEEIFREFNPRQPTLDAYEADPRTANAMFQKWAASANWMTA